MDAHKAGGELWQEGDDGHPCLLLLLLRRVAIPATAAAGIGAAAAAGLRGKAPELLIVHAVLLEEQQQVLSRNLEGVRHCQAPIVEVHRWQLRLGVGRQHSELIEGVPSCVQLGKSMPCL